MAVKVAINGFGRIGRNVLRAIVESGRTDIEVVAINDLGPVETNAHLLRYDSVHGRFPAKVKVTENGIDVGRGEIRVTAIRDPRELPWGDVDIAMECTGIFTTYEKAKVHLENGSKKVLVSAPVSADKADQIKTIVYGGNHASLTAEDRVVSNASCTTNCLAPVAKVLNDAIGITRGFMTTIHSYTGDQPTLDTMHKDLTFEAARETTTDEINDAIRNAAGNQLTGILGFTDEKLVSADFNHDPHSSVFHTDQTKVMDGVMCRVLSWYDNEWGFSNRMADTAVAMARAS